MNEILIALAAGAVIAWLMRGAFARAALAAIETRLGSLEQQHARKVSELDALKADYARSVELLRGESERRAAAEAMASRVPDLEARLAESNRTLAAQGSMLAELETRIAEERKATEEKLKLVSEAEKKAPAVRERREAVKVLTRCDVALISTKPSKSEKAEESGKVDKLTSDDIETYLKVLADRVHKAHRSGATTLAILNTVERAQGLFVELENRKQPGTAAHLALI